MKFSLNLANSEDYDKIEKWYGYQSYFPSDNKDTTITILSCNVSIVKNRKFLVTRLPLGFVMIQ